jgi:uncharacterized protein
MAQLDRMNKLLIKKLKDYGACLDGGAAGDIILPKKYISGKCRVGDEVEVFVYSDKNDRLRATTRKPVAIPEQFSRLRVVADSAAGTYLASGLPKDVFVPKSEQQVKMEKGRSYIVYVYSDPSTNRMFGSSKLDKYFNLKPARYKEGEEVELCIFRKTDLGYNAIINNSHIGVVYENEIFQKLHLGQKLNGYIKKIREDRKIDLSLQQPGHQRIDDISQTIYNTIENDGKISITDKSQPEEIYAMFGVSKKIFKKAIGALYKRRLIIIEDNGIKLNKK